MTPRYDFSFASTGGLKIMCYRWDSQTAGKPRAVIQIAHGMTEHSLRYLGLIDVLTSAGFKVYANDHRGHGRTASATSSFGDFGAGGFDLLVEDMWRLSRVAKNETPGVPLILLGHSMGSFAAQQYALEHSREISGLVLSGSGVLDGLAELARSAPAGTNILNAPFEPARTPVDWLSRDTAVVDAFMNDPLCFAALRPAAFGSFLDAQLWLANPFELRKVRKDLPILLISGSEDPVGQNLIGVEQLAWRYRRAGLGRVTERFYRGGRHEMFNEINRDQVHHDLLGWLGCVLGVSSSSRPLASAGEPQ
jgi:alpha-beta hydrolase superfamily lysophospholipase